MPGVKLHRRALVKYMLLRMGRPCGGAVKVVTTPTSKVWEGGDLEEEDVHGIVEDALCLPVKQGRGR